MVSRGRLLMLCPTLVDQGGHEYDYTMMLAAESLKQGREVHSFLPSLMADMTIDPLGKGHRILPAYGYPSGRFQRLWAAVRRIRDYVRILNGHGKQQDRWFVHSAPQNELIVIMLAWIVSGVSDQHLILFLRQTIHVGMRRQLFRYLSRMGMHKNIHLVSDGDVLAREATSYLETPVHHLPIPVEISPVSSEDQVICGYFGACRRVKGFHHLSAFVESARSLSLGWSFMVQAYQHRDDKLDTDIVEAINHFRTQSDLRLIETSLSTDAFAQAIAQCKVILLPYDADNYRVATSGVFVMAVVARAVVIVTAGTWMERQMVDHSLTRVVIVPDNPTMEDMRQALQLAHEKAQSPDVPSREERLWCEEQNAESVLHYLWRITGEGNHYASCH